MWLPAVFFLLTCLSTTTVGALLGLGFSQTPLDALPSGFWSLVPVLARHGFPFAFAIMTILTCHEMGHYLTARLYGVDSTLPYFIPFPLSFVGTLGAFILIRSPFPHRRALLDIGLAGPFAGFLATIPFLVIGVAQSRPASISALSEGGEVFGEPLLFAWVAELFGPELGAGETLLVSPFAFAAWFGLFLTALNLMPIGQLDGGHATYAVFGRRAHQISRVAFFLLIPLSYLAPTWLFWALLAWLLGIRRPHPPTLRDGMPVPTSRLWMAAIALAMFAICFTPQPIEYSWTRLFTEFGLIEPS